MSDVIDISDHIAWFTPPAVDYVVNVRTKQIVSAYVPIQVIPKRRLDPKFDLTQFNGLTVRMSNAIRSIELVGFQAHRESSISESYLVSYTGVSVEAGELFRHFDLYSTDLIEEDEDEDLA